MDIIRRQLTLFPAEPNGVIEKIWAAFNPVQYQLIAAHVTLCREDEIEPIESVLKNIRSIQLDHSIKIQFNSIERFDNGKGVLMTAGNNNADFYELRKTVLKGIMQSPGEHLPHITLMHPRNAVCTDAIFTQIKNFKLPGVLRFDTISLIEQRNRERWKTIEQFSIVK